MLRVGLTGGLASGKSFVGRALASLGCLVLKADELGHAVLEPGGEAFDAVVREFGAGILDQNGAIDRKRLAAEVFGKPDRLAVLNALVHPPVIRREEELMAELREISGEWLRIPGRRERQFSLGIFDEEYVCGTPVFLVRDSAGCALAFANLIPSCRPGESTADLMRRRPSAPNGTMEYLFVKLLFDQRDRGFERFNLGMAPMAGFQEREPATPEERAVHAFFQRLNFVFSFKGLRAFKAKFATSWEPRYIIYRDVLDLPRLAWALHAVSGLPKHHQG